MSWLTKNVGTLGNLASRIAAEANGDHQQGADDALLQLHHQLEETRKELFERHQEWERAKQDYEARLKSLAEGDTEKVDQLEQKLNRAVELLKTLSNDKKNLTARISVLEEEKRVAGATGAVSASPSPSTTSAADGSSSDHAEGVAHRRILQLESELESEKEKGSLLAQDLHLQLSTLVESNNALKKQLDQQREDSDNHADLSIQLELTREELEEAKGEIHRLQTANAEIASQSRTAEEPMPQSPAASALTKDLADAKLTITRLESQLAKESGDATEITALKTSQEELQDTVTSMREELARTKADYADVQTKLSDATEAKTELEKKETSMAASLAQLGSQLSSLQATEKEDKRKLAEQYDNEKRALLASRDQLEREREDLKKQYEERSSEQTTDETHSKLKELYEAEKTSLLAAQDSLRQEMEALRKKHDDDTAARESTLREQDTMIRDLEKSVATSEQTLKSINEDLQRTTGERNHFQAQHKTLLDRVSNMKSTLGTKLQADMVRLLDLNENINTLRQHIDQLSAQNNSYLHTIKQLEEELIASHDHYEKTSRELEHLRRRLVDIQEDASAEVVEKENLIHELQSRLQREEREREDWETMASEQRAGKDQAIMNMRAMERERDAARSEKDSLRQELDREIESLNNLQTVLEEFQSTKDSEIQFALEGLQRELRISTAALEEYKERAHVAEKQLQHLTLDVEKARQLEKDVKDKNQTIGRLRHEAVIQQGHLNEAMRRLKEENSQNTVDIPLISNLFISFLNIPRGDQKRFEILQLISGVLKFTDEQREQAGLIRKANSGLGAMTPTTSGSRSPSMEQMRQHQEPKEPLQIHWHDKQPIYSAHFEPGPKGRLATAGGDGNVRLWKVVKDKEKDSTHIEFLSSLNRHTAAVNVVRFSPAAECLASAGDDGNIILWRPSETKDAAAKFAESDDDEFERETWRVQSMMRGSLSDIYDLAWSPDGRYIISGSIDNTARIWDVKDAKCIHVIADHHHYVQGVAWDPLGEFVATQSSDRSVHIYAFKLDKHGHVAISNLGKSTKLDLTKLRSVPQPPTSGPTATTTGGTKNASGEAERTADAPSEGADAAKPARTVPKSFRLYHDETLTSFFRRLTFTPDGSMLLAPAGQYKAPIYKAGVQKEDDLATAPQMPDLETRNTVYVYARRDFSKGPVAHLPGHKKPSVAIKCSPVLYELRTQVQPPNQSSDYHPRAPNSEAPANGAHTTPKSSMDESKSAPKAPSIFGLGYRSIYAVATQDSILIYDTQQSTALALVSHLHYATFTDMAWSSDGCNLILTSSDGFCSIISFEEGELGTVYAPTKEMMALLSTTEGAAVNQSETLETTASVAATAGMLQKLTSLSLAEQKEQKEQKEQHSKAKPKQDKVVAIGEGKKTTVKQLFSKSRTTATAASLTTNPGVKTSFKKERDGDSVMASADEQPSLKKRRTQPQSALASTSPSTPTSTPTLTASASAVSIASPSTPTASTTPPMPVVGVEQKPRKRIQPTFVSALPGR
ncbi:hypothetical protein BGZ99_006196 [Dissophora globulifera]|uniref:GRIP domain-containing protein n=1 Tax=Dissophora globulifera TaxID=979702 RepID=A0A9P6RCV2_9FUNG|nr:hypothetical protein BGZ99_006196 [Dissophora globulifera]